MVAPEWSPYAAYVAYIPGYVSGTREPGREGRESGLCRGAA